MRSRVTFFSNPAANGPAQSPWEQAVQAFQEELHQNFKNGKENTSYLMNVETLHKYFGPYDEEVTLLLLRWYGHSFKSHMNALAELLDKSCLCLLMHFGMAQYAKELIHFLRDISEEERSQLSVLEIYTLFSKQLGDETVYRVLTDTALTDYTQCGYIQAKPFLPRFVLELFDLKKGGNWDIEEKNWAYGAGTPLDFMAMAGKYNIRGGRYGSSYDTGLIPVSAHEAFCHAILSTDGKNTEERLVFQIKIPRIERINKHEPGTTFYNITKKAYVKQDCLDALDAYYKVTTYHEGAEDKLDVQESTTSSHYESFVFGYIPSCAIVTITPAPDIKYTQQYTYTRCAGYQAPSDVPIAASTPLSEEKGQDEAVAYYPPVVRLIVAIKHHQKLMAECFPDLMEADWAQMLVKLETQDDEACKQLFERLLESLELRKHLRDTLNILKLLIAFYPKSLEILEDKQKQWHIKDVYAVAQSFSDLSIFSIILDNLPERTTLPTCILTRLICNPWPEAQVRSLGMTLLDKYPDAAHISSDRGVYEFSDVCVTPLICALYRHALHRDKDFFTDMILDRIPSKRQNKCTVEASLAGALLEKYMLAENQAKVEKALLRQTAPPEQEERSAGLGCLCS